MVKNVLHITARADVGGGPEHLFQLVRHLDTECICSYVACPDDIPYSERYQELLGKERVFFIPHRKLNFMQVVRLARWIKENEIDIVHSHGKGAGAYALLLKLFVRLPWIHTPHGIHVGEYGKWKKRLYVIYEQFSSLFIQYVIHVSQGEKDESLRLNMWPKSQLHVINNGTEAVEFSEAMRIKVRDTLGVDRDVPVILSVSRFDFQKNMEESFAIARELPDTIFIWLGDGEQRQHLELEAKKQCIKNIHFLGNVSNVKSYMQAADVYLSSARWEGMSLAVLEAMSCGLPLLLSDVIGNRDLVIDGENGRLYPLGEAKSAVEILKEWFSDREKLSVIGKKSREIHGEFYSVKKMAENTQKLYFVS